MGFRCGCRRALNSEIRTCSVESCRLRLEYQNAVLKLRSCFSLMDRHTLLQRFRYITSLASLSYTFTALHTIQYAMRDHNNDNTTTTMTEPPQLLDLDSTTPSTSTSTANHNTLATTSTTKNLDKTSSSRWTESEINLLLDYVEGHCILTTARGLNLKKAEFTKARTTVGSKDANQCHYKWGNVRIFIINVGFHHSSML